jgi:hypothetical protein
VKGLSIKQPWTFAIAAGFKPIENRSRATKHRGPLALQASLTMDSPGCFPTRTPSGRAAAEALRALGGRGNCWDARCKQIGTETRHPLLAMGAVIAVADVVDVCAIQGGYTDCDCGDWAAPFQCHWKLANVRPLAEPVPCKGALGLWTLPEDVEAAVMAQLGERANA